MTDSEALTEADLHTLDRFQKVLGDWSRDEERTPQALREDLSRFISWFGPIRAALSALGTAPAVGVTYSQADFDESYEIGKSDGYEEAIQELDLATGGDGEFKGSTFPGETVDVPVMKARIIERLASPAPATAAEIRAGALTFEQKTAINIEFKRLYEEGMREGKHGHYETMFGAMHKAYAAFMAAGAGGEANG